jgi:inosine-uridine nucleoside N-ribohydrolase
MKNLTVISDPGVDDLVALVLLDKLTRGEQKTLVSTYGNNAAEVTAKNARAFAATMGANWRYREGAKAPLNGQVTEAWLDGAQGDDGLWGYRPTNDKPTKEANNAPIDKLISLAPLTETACLMKSQPIKDLAIMGGFFGAVTTSQPIAELNIRLDSEAAEWVFTKCKNTQVTVIPADVAEGVYWTKAAIAQIPETNETNIWLKQLLLAGYTNGRYNSGEDFVLYDPVAIYIFFKPSLATWQRTGLKVLTTGPERGRTILSDVNPACDVAMTVIDPKRLAQQIYDVVFGTERL